MLVIKNFPSEEAVPEPEDDFQSSKHKWKPILSLQVRMDDNPLTESTEEQNLQFSGFVRENPNFDDEVHSATTSNNEITEVPPRGKELIDTPLLDMFNFLPSELEINAEKN